MRKAILALVLSALSACSQAPNGTSDEEPSEIDVYNYDFSFSRYIDHEYRVVCYHTDEMLVCFPLDTLGQTD